MKPLNRAPWRLRAAAIAVGIVSIAAFGGCDGATDPAASRFADEYGRLNDLYQERAADIQERAALVSGQGLDQIVAVYEDLLDSTRSAEDDFAALEPPPDFDPTFAEMVDVLEQQVLVMTDLVEAARARATNDVTTAAGRLAELVRDWDALDQQMKDLFAKCGEQCE